MGKIRHIKHAKVIIISYDTDDEFEQYQNRIKDISIVADNSDSFTTKLEKMK